MVQTDHIPCTCSSSSQAVCTRCRCSHKHGHDVTPGRLHALACFSHQQLALPLLLQVQSGAVYEGVFNAMGVGEAGVNMVLHYARMTKDPSGKLFSKEEVAERPQPKMFIDASDVVQVFARDIKMSPEDLEPTSDMGFETDAAISRGRGG